MGQPLITERRVEFRDTDAAGIMHFSVYFTCMEEAEHELFRQAGLSVVSQFEGRTISWPRVSAHCDYRGSFRFEDIIKIEAGITNIGRSSMSLGFRFFKSDQSGIDEPLATGAITTVCCIIDEMPPQSISIPDSIREKLAPYVIV